MNHKQNILIYFECSQKTLSQKQNKNLAREEEEEIIEEQQQKQQQHQTDTFS